MAKGIVRAVTELRSGSPAMAAMIDAGRRTAANYNVARQAGEVVSFMRGLLQ